MMYIIVEEVQEKTYLINDEVYQSKEQAINEKSYLQVDYDNPLRVKEII